MKRPKSRVGAVRNFDDNGARANKSDKNSTLKMPRFFWIPGPVMPWGEILEKVNDFAKVF